VRAEAAARDEVVSHRNEMEAAVLAQVRSPPRLGPTSRPIRGVVGIQRR
jgi:hypothetical protein